jgi:hypothetical protein
MYNYATHKTPLIRSWLAKRPRWHVHFDANHSSWFNQIERFFALITERKSDAASIAVWLHYAPRSRPSSNITTPIQSRSDEPNQPTIFSAQSNASALTISKQGLKCHELLAQDTRMREASATKVPCPTRASVSPSRRASA